MEIQGIGTPDCRALTVAVAVAEQEFGGNAAEQDDAEAFRLYQLAANQGFPVAMFATGDCYYLGRGVEQDYQQAAEWYLKSLNAGYTPDEEDQKHIVDVAGKS